MVSQYVEEGCLTKLQGRPVRVDLVGVPLVQALGLSARRNLSRVHGLLVTEGCGDVLVQLDPPAWAIFI